MHNRNVAGYDRQPKRFSLLGNSLTASLSTQSGSAPMFITPKRVSDRLRPNRVYVDPQCQYDSFCSRYTGTVQQNFEKFSRASMKGFAVLRMDTPLINVLSFFRPFSRRCDVSILNRCASHFQVHHILHRTCLHFPTLFPILSAVSLRMH